MADDVVGGLGRGDAGSAGRADNRKLKLMADPEYREVRRESARKWRADHAGYWKQYRTTHPQSAERNRTLQRRRDQRHACSILQTTTRL